MGAFEKVWREFESNEITHSAAHYLLALASWEKNGESPRAADLARQLGVSRAAVSLQIKVLLGQRLVKAHQKDHRISLTREGADLVARIVSKREAVRTFLEEVLGVSKKTAELDGCKVEHLLSEETGAALVRLIEFLRSADPVARAFLMKVKELHR